jgi:hypothetical protein
VLTGVTIPQEYLPDQSKLSQQLTDRFPTAAIQTLYRGYWGDATVVEWMHWAVDWIASHQLTFTSWLPSNITYNLSLQTPEVIYLTNENTYETPSLMGARLLAATQRGLLLTDMKLWTTTALANFTEGLLLPAAYQNLQVRRAHHRATLTQGLTLAQSFPLHLPMRLRFISRSLQVRKLE